MIKTINSILSISKVESGTSDLNRNPVSLKELILNMHELYEPIAESDGIKLNYEKTEIILNHELSGTDMYDLNRQKIIEIKGLNTYKRVKAF